MRTVRALVALVASLSGPLRAEPRMIETVPPAPPRAERVLTLVDSGNGFVETAVWIASEAGFIPDLARMPGPRVIVEFRERPPEMTCAGGWFRTPERETFARFTEPFRFDPPEGVVVSARVAERARALGGNAALFADTSLRFLAYPSGIRVSDVFDRLYERRGDVNVSVMRTDYLDRRAVTRLLVRDRIDAAPGFNAEQFNEMLSIAREEGASLEFLLFPDGPARNTRHIMCSRSVSPEVVEDLDRAISRIGSRLHERLSIAR